MGLRDSAAHFTAGQLCPQALWGDTADLIPSLRSTSATPAPGPLHAAIFMAAATLHRARMLSKDR